MEQLFLFLNRLTTRSKLPFFTIAGLILLASLFLASHLGFEEDITRMMPVDKEMQRINKLMKKSGFRDRLIINIYHPDSVTDTDTDQLISYGDRLVDSLNRQLSPYVDQITYQVSEGQMNRLYDDIYRHLPAFLDKSDYRKLDSMITETGVQKAVRKGYKALISPSSFAMKDKILKDPLNITPLALEDLQSLKYGDEYVVDEGRLFSSSKRHLLLFVTPSYPSSETGKNRTFLNKLDGILKRILRHNSNSRQQCRTAQD